MAATLPAVHSEHPLAVGVVWGQGWGAAGAGAHVNAGVDAVEAPQLMPHGPGQGVHGGVRQICGQPPHRQPYHPARV